MSRLWRFLFTGEHFDEHLIRLRWIWVFVFKLSLMRIKNNMRLKCFHSIPFLFEFVCCSSFLFFIRIVIAPILLLNNKEQFCYACTSNVLHLKINEHNTELLREFTGEMKQQLRRNFLLRLISKGFGEVESLSKFSKQKHRENRSLSLVSK